VTRTVLAAATLAAGIGLLAAGCGGNASGTGATKAATTKSGATKSGATKPAAATKAAATKPAATKSGATKPAAATTAAATKSGTETISGTLKGAAAMTSNPVFHLTFRGPVNTTASYPLGSSPKKGRTHTFKTAVGDFVIVGGMGTTTQKLLSTSTCRFEFATTVPYTVSAAESTGKFAGATGSGKAVVLFQGDLPKLKNGKCNESATAQPTVSTVVTTFKAAGPLTVR